MIAYLLLFCSALCSALRIRRDLVLENLALRHQLLVLSRSSRRPTLLVLACPPLDLLAFYPGPRPAGHGRSLAPHRLAALLDVEESPRWSGTSTPLA